MNIASLRILRLAGGTALSLWFSQIFAWEMSYIAPVVTLLILALPVPAPGLKGGLAFVLALTLSMYAGLLLLPMLLEQPAAGVLLLVLALFWSFYYTEKGGSMLLGTLATVGIAVSTAVGTVSLDAVFAVISGLSRGACAGVVFMWIAHAILPDSYAVADTGQPAAKPASPPESKPDLAVARWGAYRSTMIVLPVALLFLFSSASTAYVPVLIKVASMGQQAGREGARTAGSSLIMSTIIGGAGAVIGWQILRVVPTLSMYTLFIAAAGLLIGPRIFQGPGMHPRGSTWSYGFLTMIVILAPAVMDSAGGAAAGIKFSERLVMFALTTVYAVLAVSVFDAFKPKPKAEVVPQQ
jgi:hypothetical protein